MISAFSSMIVDKEGACSYNQLHKVANLDIWHQKMGHIGLLRLYNLRKKCLRVNFKVKRYLNALTACCQKYLNRYHGDYPQIK